MLCDRRLRCGPASAAERAHDLVDLLPIGVFSLGEIDLRVGLSLTHEA
jgi:hypothetical protein